jgi:hypothetical protein
LQLYYFNQEINEKHKLKVLERLERLNNEMYERVLYFVNTGLFYTTVEDYLKGKPKEGYCYFSNLDFLYCSKLIKYKIPLGNIGYIQQTITISVEADEMIDHIRKERRRIEEPIFNNIQLIKCCKCKQEIPTTREYYKQIFRQRTADHIICDGCLDAARGERSKIFLKCSTCNSENVMLDVHYSENIPFLFLKMT